MKKSFEMPIVNVVRFEAKDVITTSNIPAGEVTPDTQIPAFGESKRVDAGRFVW